MIYFPCYYGVVSEPLRVMFNRYEIPYADCTTYLDIYDRFLDKWRKVQMYEGIILYDDCIVITDTSQSLD